MLIDWRQCRSTCGPRREASFKRATPPPRTGVDEKARELLSGGASIVAATMRREPTMLSLDETDRKAADACADYLLAKAPYLDYPTALSSGWPIATGIIEGAVRHVVKDRMDITGGRWDSIEPRPCPSFALFGRTVIGPTTGRSTCQRNTSGSTNPATSPVSSPGLRERPSQGGAPEWRPRARTRRTASSARSHWGVPASSNPPGHRSCGVGLQR